MFLAIFVVSLQIQSVCLSIFHSFILSVFSFFSLHNFSLSVCLCLSLFHFCLFAWWEKKLFKKETMTAFAIQSARVRWTHTGNASAFPIGMRFMFTCLWATLYTCAVTLTGSNWCFSVFLHPTLTFFSKVSAKAANFFSKSRFLKLVFCWTSWIAFTNLPYNSSLSLWVLKWRRSGYYIRLYYLNSIVFTGWTNFPTNYNNYQSRWKVIPKRTSKILDKT